MNPDTKAKLIFALIFFLIGIHNITSSFIFNTHLISTVCFYSGIFSLLISAGHFGSAWFARKEGK